MVVKMGLSTALTVSVCTASVGSLCSSSTGSSSGDINGGHGFRPAPALAMTKKNLDPLPKVVVSSWGTPWTRELSFGGRRKPGDGRGYASSSDETSGEKGPVSTENVPGWAKPNSDELPPWAKNERPASQEPGQDFPFGVYLIGSTLVAIAAVGSIFEYFNKNPVFGVIRSDSPFYTPILGFFAITGFPTAVRVSGGNVCSVLPFGTFPLVLFITVHQFPQFNRLGFLLYKSIQLANKASEEADKEDGFRR